MVSEEKQKRAAGSFRVCGRFVVGDSQGDDANRSGRVDNGGLPAALSWRERRRSPRRNEKERRRRVGRRNRPPLGVGGMVVRRSESISARGEPEADVS
jgi:hypothetical protein